MIVSHKDDKGFDHPNYYASRQLIVVERNYTTRDVNIVQKNIYFQLIWLNLLD